MNLNNAVSVTENFLTERAVKDELPIFKYFDGTKPFSFKCKGCIDRIWRNLMGRDLKDVEVRRYAVAMLRQIKRNKIILEEMGHDHDHDEDNHSHEDEEDDDDEDEDEEEDDR